MGKKQRQGSKIALVRSYLRVPQAAGQVKILLFLVKIENFPIMPLIFVMQGKCLFLDISRPEREPQHEPAESKSVILCLRFIELIQKNQSHHNSR